MRRAAALDGRVRCGWASISSLLAETWPAHGSPSQVVPGGRVVRRDGEFLLGVPERKGLQHRVKYEILTVTTGSPDFPLAAVAAHPALEADKEPVVPRRVVPHVLRQELLDVLELAVPHLLRLVRLFRRGELRVGEGAGRVEVAEDPLSVRPSVVVLGVECEGLRGEFALAGRVVERKNDVSAVLPAGGSSTEIYKLVLCDKRARSQRTRPGRT